MVFSLRPKSIKATDIYVIIINIYINFYTLHKEIYINIIKFSHNTSNYINFMININDFNTFYQLIIISVIALIIGSFVSLITYRIDQKHISAFKGFIFTRSKCPNCQNILKFYNLIPLFSWIIQLGKCSKCYNKISTRYPLIESSFLLFFIINYFATGQIINYQFIFLCAIASILIYMCIIDLEHYYIPDLSQYVLAVVITSFVIYQSNELDISYNLLSSLAYLGFGIALWLLFYYGAGIEAIGIDDLKFFFIAGFALTLDNFLIFMLLSGVFGLLYGSLWQYLKKDDSFPFAPSICLSFYIGLLIKDKFDAINIIGRLFF